ncbi:MAG: hypothetical protein ACAH11_16045 [Sphingomonas sp.]
MGGLRSVRVAAALLLIVQVALFAYASIAGLALGQVFAVFDPLLSALQLIPLGVLIATRFLPSPGRLLTAALWAWLVGAVWLMVVGLCDIAYIPNYPKFEMRHLVGVVAQLTAILAVTIASLLTVTAIFMRSRPRRPAP